MKQLGLLLFYFVMDVTLVHHKIIAQNIPISVFIIQLCFVDNKNARNDYKYYTILILYLSYSPDCAKEEKAYSQYFVKRKRWIVNLLLYILVCSIAVYFYLSFVF